MNNEKNLKQVDSLMGLAFAPGEGQAPLGFEARVMAAVAAKQEESFWEALKTVARPLLVSGWALAAALGVLVLANAGNSQEAVLAAYFNGDTLVRWFM